MTISGLIESTNPSSNATVPIVDGGQNKKCKLLNLVKGMPEATGSQKGLMSADQVNQLDDLQERVDTLYARPVVQNIASAATITVSSGTDVIRLSGTTDVTTVNTPDEYKIYTVHYPTGTGLSFLGTPLTAGSAILLIGVHS